MAIDEATLNAAIRALEDFEIIDDVSDEEEFEHITGQKIPTRDDQVLNNAGGYVFQVTDEMRVRRFLVLGNEGGTYYVNQDDMKKESVEELIRMINEGKGEMILREIYEINKENRAPKRDFSLYLLALCARYGNKAYEASDNEETRKFKRYLHVLQAAAFKLVPLVCKISTNLFMFINFSEQISKEYNNGKTGWGRMMRATIANWYLKRHPKALALQLSKYKSRCGYSHRDVLRLCHANPNQVDHWTDDKENDNILYDYLFNYAVSGKLDKDFGDSYTDDRVEMLRSSDVAKFLEAVVKVATLKTDNETECAQMIREHQLVREHIPTDLLNSATVWKALLEKMPMTAMVRNLAKMSTLDLITGEKPENEEWVQKVVGNLTSEEKIKNSGIHPFSLLLAKSVYEKGAGIRGSLTFRTNPFVLDALEKAFLLSFKNVVPTGKRYLVALDVSSSMGSPMGGSVLSCYDAEIAMSMVWLRTEPKVDCVAFKHTLEHIPVNQQTSFQEFRNRIYNAAFGQTDCSLPMTWAKEQKKEYDVFVVCTDSETYYGNIHPYEAVRQYREASGIKDAKLIVVGFTGTKFTIADPKDSGMLDVVGFDSASPSIISDFVLGRL